MPLWLANSGASTLRNYRRTGGRIEDAHLAWLAALPFCHDDGLRFFVHAGIDLTVPLDRQSPEVMLWMREPFLSDCDAVDCGRFIVHGHTPLRDRHARPAPAPAQPRHRRGDRRPAHRGGVRRQPRRAGGVLDGWERAG